MQMLNWMKVLHSPGMPLLLLLCTFCILPSTIYHTLLTTSDHSPDISSQIWNIKSRGWLEPIHSFVPCINSFTPCFRASIPFTLTHTVVSCENVFQTVDPKRPRYIKKKVIRRYSINGSNVGGCRVNAQKLFLGGGVNFLVHS